MTSTISRLVIAGAGLAALRAAQAARQAGHEGSLVVIGDEPHLPYNRPPLSKEVLKGTQEIEKTAFPGIDKVDAEWRLGVAVTAVDPAAHTVTLSDGTTVDYDRLIIATGARARTLPGQEADAGVHMLRGRDDAERLAAELPSIGRLAIVGAGFVGCEVAASARAHGVEVTLLDLAPHPLVPIGAELGDRIGRLHEAHGVQLRLGAAIAGVRPDGVDLADGSTVEADAVLVAIGAAPNTEFLEGSGIERNRGGIVCDATLTSVSDPDVLAAGDVAAWPACGGRFGDESIRVEHWTTAAEHGRVAGPNALLDPAQRTAHVAPPYVWSDQYDCKIQVAGFPARAATIEIVEEEPGDGTTPARLLAEARDADGELIGAVAFNHARRLAEYRGRLAEPIAH